MADEAHPNDMTRWGDIACQRGHAAHDTRRHLMSLAEPNAYTDCTPIPERFRSISFTLELWDFAEVGGPSHPYCPQADLVSETIVRYGIWEPRETVAMLLAFEALSIQFNPWRFIDIGAQLGWFSILAQHFDAEVLAVEADPEVAAVLARNLGGEAEVMVRRIGPRTRLLDADDTPTVIKIDVEGAEPEALRWCRKLFEVGSVRFAMIEVSPVFHDRYLELLRDLIVGFGFEMADMPAKSRPPHAVETLNDFTWWGPDDWETVVEWLGLQHQANVLLRASA